MQLKTKLAIILVFIILNILIMPSNSIHFYATEPGKIDSHLAEEMLSPSTKDASTTEISKLSIPEASVSSASGSSTPKSSSIIYPKIDINYVPSEKQNFVDIRKYIISHNIDENYNYDHACVMVVAENIAGQSLEDIDVCEYISSDATIINCTIPIIISSISRLARPTQKGFYLFAIDDINNKKNLNRALNYMPENNLTICNLNEMYLKRNGNKTSPSLTDKILDSLNDFVLNETKINSIKYINKSNFSKEIHTLLNLDNNSKLQIYDKQLMHYLLIKETYKDYIINNCRNNITIIENCSFDRMAGFIHFNADILKAKESIVYIYFINLSDHAIQQTMTCFDTSNNRYDTSKKYLDILFPAPQFSIEGDYSKQEIEPNTNLSIKYIIHYQNGIALKSSHNFTVSINDSDTDMIVDPKNFLIYFSPDRYSFEKNITVRVSEPGLYCIPSLSIMNSTYIIDNRYIKVEPLWHKYILEITIIILAFCTLIGSNFKWLSLRKNLLIRIGASILLWIFMDLILQLCEYTQIYYISILSIIILCVIVWWWRNSLEIESLSKH